MPIVRVKDIVSMSAEDKTNKLYDLRAELARIRTMINAGGAVENPTKVRELRKAIAQILTVQNEEKLGIRKTTEPKAAKKAEKPKATKTKKTTQGENS
jgi:large subunit ribosomal protein L29